MRFGTGRYNRKYKFFKKYSVQEQQTDLKILKTALEKIHPGLYWYVTKEEFETTYNKLYNGINSEKTAYQLIDYVFILIAKIHCSHTEVDLSGIENTFRRKNLKRFPLNITVIDNKLFVKDNFSADSLLKPGTEIVTINGVKTSDLLQNFIKRSYVDGFNRQGEFTYLADNFKRLITFYFNSPSAYTLEILTNNGALIKKEIQAVYLSEIIDKYNKKYPIEESQTFTLVDSLKTAILTFNNFTDTTFDKFLEQSFKTIQDKNIRNLIIDIRKNGGGYDTYGLKLYAYIALSKFNYYSHLEMTIDNLSDTIFKYGSFDDTAGVSSLFDKNHAKKMPNGNYILNKKQHQITADETFSSEKNNFKGKVYVLISNESFSGASEFSAISHSLKRAKFIGQETGGGYCGNTSGFNFDLNLPNTKIHIIIPICRYISAIESCQSKGGIKPDCEITPNIDDLKTNADREMKFALDLIRKK